MLAVLHSRAELDSRAVVQGTRVVGLNIQAVKDSLAGLLDNRVELLGSQPETEKYSTQCYSNMQRMNELQSLIII